MPLFRLLRFVLLACLLPLVAASISAQQVAAPQLNPAPGPKVNSPTVTLSTTTSGATIRYTLDGSAPTAATGTVYTGPILLNGAVNTLRVIAVRSGRPDSVVTTGVYPVLNNGGRSVPKPTDRGRIQVATIPDPFGANLLGGLGNTFANLPLKVLRTDSGQPLRGASPWVYKPIQNGVANTNPNYRLDSITQAWVDKLVEARLNSVRICFWDAYELAAGYATIGDSAVDFNNPAQIEILLAHFERWADLLSAAGIYMGVNYHNEFQKNTNEAHATAFWTVMARYFRDRTHLIFEITNEPAGTNWKSMDINNGAERKRQVRITKAIRDIDPDRFLLVLTPSGYSGGYQYASDLDPNITSRNFANEYLATYGVAIDWSKTAIGYHNYYDPQGTSGLIRALHREFPAFWTETGLGPAVRDAYNASSNQPKLGNLEFGPTLDGDRSNIQTAEKLGIGWWQWTSDSQDRQTRIWPFVQADAISNNYWWPADTGIPAPPEITSPVSASSLLNQPFTYQIIASNAANAYAASNLPPGLALNPATGLISGTPTAAGVRLVTLTASNALGDGTAILTLGVSTPEPLVTQNFNSGGTGSWFAYSGDGGVSHTLAAPTNGPDASPALNLAVTVATPAATYWYAGTGVVTSGNPPFTASTLAQTYVSVDVRTSTAAPAEIILVFKTPNNGTLSRTFSVPGGTWTTLSAPLSSFSSTNFDYNAASYEFMLQKGNSGWPLSSSSLRVDNVALVRPAALPPAPVITSATTLSAARDAAFSYTIAATNSPSSFAATGLPAGLTFDPLTGVISGSPTATGSSQITLAATNAEGTGTATLTLVVTPPLPAITSAVSAITLLGAPFSYTITATESPTVFTATGLPAGLSINTSTGVISGTPTAVGTSEITLGAANLAGSGTSTLTLTVNPPAPVISSPTTATTVLGVPFSYTATASNSPASFSADGLPAGLSINPTTGLISGTPTALGVRAVTIGATNVSGTGTATLTLTVSLLVPLLAADFEAGAGSWFAYSGDGGVTRTFSAQPNGPSGGSALNLALAVAAPPATYWYAGAGITTNSTPPFNPSNLAQTFVSLDAWVSASPSAEIIVAIKTPNGGTLTRTFSIPANTWTPLSAALSTFTATNFDYNASSFEILIQKGDAGWPLATSSFRLDNFVLQQIAPVPPAPVITSAATASVAYGAPFSYTITASNSPASFAATGLPAGLVLDPATGILSGTTSVHGASVITLGATNAGGTGQATLTLTVTLSPVEQWRLTYFGTPDAAGEAAPDADEDADGLSNLLEYALATDPLDPSDTGIPACALNPSASSLTFTFLRARADLTYEVLATSDLANPASWQVIATNPGVVSDTEPVTVTDPESVSENPARFLRLRVSL